MKLDFMILANYAEGPPQSPLLHMIGGAWDTINVGGPLPPEIEAPEGTVTVLQGYLAARILLHPTELAKERSLRITVIDEDGAEIGAIEGGFRAEKDPSLPVGWDQGVNIVLPLAGLALRRFGLYRVSLLVDDTHLGERQFRVLKAY